MNTVRTALLLLAFGLVVGCVPRPTTSSSSPPPGAMKGAEAKVPESNPNNPIVLIDTSMGPIKVELFPDKAPVTVKNFLTYVDDKFYDGTIFHRIIPTFMIQGGGFEPSLKQKKTKDPIKNESDNGLSNQRGTIAMARTNAPDSATSQFFINVVDNGNQLDSGKTRDGVGYCVFGRVIEGMDVVDKIKDVKTGTKMQMLEVDGQLRPNPMQDVPTEDVLIKSIRRVEKK